jgi:hypothetical protein
MIIFESEVHFERNIKTKYRFSTLAKVLIQSEITI